MRFLCVGLALVASMVSARLARAEPVEPPTAETETRTDKAKAGDEARGPKVDGYIQTFYRYAFETGEDGLVDNDHFRVMRVRIGVEGDIYPWLSYDIEIDPRAPEVRGILRDAFVEVKRFVPHHEIRIGQQKTQFGYTNPTSSTLHYTVNRPEIADALMRGINLRDAGIGLLGKVKLADGWRLEDAVTLTNGSGLNRQEDDTDRMNVWGRVGVRYKRPGLRISWGVSGGWGDFVEEGDLEFDPSDDFVLQFTRIGTDLQIKTPWLLATAELAFGTDDTPDETADASGYYVELVGRTGRNIGPVARVDTFDDEFRRWTVGAYYGKRRAPLRVLVNYEYREIFDGARGDDKLYIWMQAKF